MKNTNDLHPLLQEKITQLLSICKAKGYNIGIGECVRTVKEQNGLYAKGRTVKGNIVTNANGSSYSSMHQWGVAFDFYRDSSKDNSKGAFDDSDGFFSKVGAIGRSIGLEWGGDWKSIKDKPHFQLKDWGSTTSQLKAKYGTPDKFKATWNKADKFKVPAVINKQSRIADVTYLQMFLNKLDKIKNTKGKMVSIGLPKLKVDGWYGTKTVEYVNRICEIKGWKACNDGKEVHSRFINFVCNVNII